MTEALQTLRGLDDKLAIQLSLTPAKPPVIHGLDGLSRKAEGAGHASHYISFTRLATSGTIVLNCVTYQVQGTSWMDHELFSGSRCTRGSRCDLLILQRAD